ncbi:hypothetical protein KKI24_16055 [bacterium]|nr:hypothetical protein [bacterium]
MTRSTVTVLLALFQLCFLLPDPTLAVTKNRELVFSLNKPSSLKSKPQFESEHRPVFKRRYWIHGSGLSAAVSAFVRHPDGSMQDLAIETADNLPCISFQLRHGDGPHHGIHNSYVIHRQVKDGTLIVRTAKWSTVHHSCAWGHDYKYNSSRLAPATVDKVPLELSGIDLWDGNFHVLTRSGQKLQFTVFHYGKPLPDAKITVISDKKWVRQLVSDSQGTISFQMIRDYYPESWDRFQKTKNSNLLLKAEYEFKEEGSLDGVPYTSVQLVSTLPWRYFPAHQDFSSYQAGLAVGGISFLAAVAGLFFYRMKRRRPFQEFAFDEKTEAKGK